MHAFSRVRFSAVFTAMLLIRMKKVFSFVVFCVKLKPYDGFLLGHRGREYE